MEPCIRDSIGRWSEWGDSFAFSSPGEENRCVAAVETGGIYQLNDHLWEGKYSPRDAHGKRISRNVYAKTREECEEKLAAMIEEVKKEIAAEKEKMRTAI